MKKSGIYIHIPFCRKKCRYCDFYSIISNESMRSVYVDKLITHLRRIRPDLNGNEVDSIYIGGGTPSLISAQLLEKLFEEIYLFDIPKDHEITMEVNPGTVDQEKVKVMKSLGINRVSIGAQSMCDDELKFLGRIHNTKDITKSYRMFRNEGFDNISFDMLFAIPMQTFSSFKKTLSSIISLDPEHISAYPLKIEEDTEFGKMLKNGMLENFNESLDREMYHYMIDRLSKKGYIHYELSNFSRPGYESVHNMKYWDLSEYTGIGASAHSFVDNERYRNHKDIYEYIADPSKKFDIERYDQKDLMKDFMMLGLRKIRGVDKKEFGQRFSKDMTGVFEKEIRYLMDESLLSDDGSNIKLTKKGLDFANRVFLEFI